uniref:Uncharacterized protein n=1 Tax=Arundo donax TaxID=35708 RepID=A0A0A9EBA1_ARUDO
MGASQASWGC